MGNYIKSGTGKSVHKDKWKVAFRLKKQYKDVTGAADEYETRKKWAYNKSNKRVLCEHDALAIEKKVKKSLEDQQLEIIKHEES